MPFRRPKELWSRYRSAQRIEIEDPKDKIFTPFGDARWKIENGEAIKSREMYFAIYQSLAKMRTDPDCSRNVRRIFLI